MSSLVRFPIYFVASFVASAVLVACFGGANETVPLPPDTGDAAVVEGSAQAPTASGLPCDVAQVLAERCQKCHSAPPIAGAPMPLVTWEDTQAPSKTAPAELVWTRMKARLHDTASPMPPDGPLAAADLAALDGWLAAGAPKSADACVAPDSGAPVPVGPDALPCPASERKTFLAHGGAANGKFHVAADAGNEYACFTWRSPFATSTQATAFAPVIDDKRVVHHWILYETATQQPDGVYGDCNMPLDARFVAGWAPGGTNNVLPDDVGQDLQGASGSFILQVHYWNVASYTDADDASGVSVCTTTTPRAHAASVVTLGTTKIAIPPHTDDYVANASCTDKATAPLHVISTAPHMHTRGTSFKTDILRGGDSARIDALVNVPRWDFNSQTNYRIDMTLNPGDVLKTECHYANTSASEVDFGEKTENEMCFNFVLVWPTSAISSIYGPVTYCND